MRIFSFLFVGLLSLSATAGTVTIVDESKGTMSEPQVIASVDLTSLGLELIGERGPLCLVTGDFLHANNVDGFNFRGYVYEDGWSVLCKRTDAVRTGAIAIRATFMPQGS